MKDLARRDRGVSVHRKLFHEIELFGQAAVTEIDSDAPAATDGHGAFWRSVNSR